MEGYHTNTQCPSQLRRRLEYSGWHFCCFTNFAMDLYLLLTALRVEVPRPNMYTSHMIVLLPDHVVHSPIEDKGGNAVIVYVARTGEMGEDERDPWLQRIIRYQKSCCR